MSRVMAVIIWAGLGMLMFLSRRESGDALRRMCLYLYKKACMSVLLRRSVLTGERQIVKSLMSLYPGQAPAELLTKYYVEKIRIVLLILGVGSLFAFGTGFSKETSGAVLADGMVSRGEEKQTILLEAQVKEKGSVIREEISLEVEERALRQQEAKDLYEEFAIYLDELMLGANESLQEVRWNLYLPDEVEGYPFLIHWVSGDSSLLGNDGEVKTEALEDAAEVTLRAEVSYGEWEWQNRWQITLQPPIRSDREQLIYDLKKYSQEAAEDHLYEESFALPDSVDGREVRWRMKEEDTGLLVLILTAAAAVAVYRLKDRDLEGELQKRRREMREAYPELVSKYALLLGAGMTVRGSFQKICNDYYVLAGTSASESAVGGKAFVPGKSLFGMKKQIHPLYEEMQYACNELQSGISESKVYENFGLRTGTAEYMRLCTLLTQNLKKGNSALVQRLRTECEEALREGSLMKKRRGEEAGTRLLLPMIMMLLMVLLMIMLPAFSGLGV